MSSHLKCILVLSYCLTWTTAAADKARIAVIGPNEEPRFSEIAGGLKYGLESLGYTELDFELVLIPVSRSDTAKARIAVEKDLIQSGVEIIFCIDFARAKIARDANSQLPIVYISSGDPVQAGLMDSYARPGDNWTALTFEYPEIAGKRLELLKQIKPTLKCVWVMYDGRELLPKQGFAAAAAIAPEIGVELVPFAVISDQQVAEALATLSDQNVDAVMVIPGGIATAYYSEIIEAATASGLPTMFHASAGATEETLASYGTSDRDVAVQAARILEKILKGEDAGEIPIERPTKIQLTINLSTAQLLGISVPAKVLVQASRVIRD